MPAKCFSETDALSTELDILRNVLLLARGPADSFFHRVDSALRSTNIQEMRRAKESFDDLSQEDKNLMFGVMGDDDLSDN